MTLSSSPSLRSPAFRLPLSAVAQRAPPRRCHTAFPNRRKKKTVQPPSAVKKLSTVCVVAMPSRLPRCTVSRLPSYTRPLPRLAHVRSYRLVSCRLLLSPGTLQTNDLTSFTRFHPFTWHHNPTIPTTGDTTATHPSPPHYDPCLAWEYHPTHSALYQSVAVHFAAVPSATSLLSVRFSLRVIAVS